MGTKHKEKQATNKKYNTVESKGHVHPEKGHGTKEIKDKQTGNFPEKVDIDKNVKENKGPEIEKTVVRDVSETGEGANPDDIHYRSQ